MKHAVLTVLLGAGVLAIGIGAGKVDARAKLVQEIDDYYQRLFRDIEPTKDGSFGITRITSGTIKSHTRDGGDPGSTNTEFSNHIAIYGNHGNPLDPETIELRYRRFTNGIPMNKAAMPSGKRTMTNEEIVFAAIKSYISGKKGPFIHKFGPLQVEARFVTLSKPECVNCHVGMKKNDPVAVMLYTTVPLVDKGP